MSTWEVICVYCEGWPDEYCLPHWNTPAVLNAATHASVVHWLYSQVLPPLKLLPETCFMLPLVYPARTIKLLLEEYATPLV